MKKVDLWTEKPVKEKKVRKRRDWISSGRDAAEKRGIVQRRAVEEGAEGM